MKTIEQIEKIIGEEFPCFGGGHDSNYNPLVKALKDKPLQFAAGVPVRAVVVAVLEHAGI